MEAYLDNSATTRCLDSVIDIMEKTMREITAIRPPSIRKVWMRRIT